MDGSLLLEARRVAPHVVQALTDSVRAAVERATAAYVTAAGTANPVLVLQQGGFTPMAAQAGATTLVLQGPATPAPSQHGLQLVALEIADVRLVAPGHVRVVVATRVAPAPTTPAGAPN